MTAPAPKGPTFDRAALEIHAGGRISEIFGPLFEQQDSYAVQCRMPEPPLLLATRVTGIDAEPGSMKKGTVWTETDVREDDWFMNAGYMPAGVMIESGQADLFLISYLGADFLNQGDRAYRLLGCELTYHRSLPRPGETLCYDIHVDGHASQGDIRLFFFHYDCHINDEPVLSVRSGQAGFFTEGELDDSAGILWKPEEQEIIAEARVDAPAVECTRSSFTQEQIRALSDADVYGCFGLGFELGQTHTRTPKIQSGDLLFLEKITDFDPKGGPWGRGYMKAVTEIHPDDWFFGGHFKNDPCMPGTLMFEGCLQMMSFYMAGLGYTLEKDGWRFEPIPDEKYQLLCRGQVIPSSKEITYEIFIEEVHDGPIPMLYADLLCTVDGLGAFHARRMGLRMVPDWPMTSMPELLANHEESKPVASAGDFQFDYASLLACAWGKPSDAFGPMYEVFDGTRRVARLPGPPYHFMSRVTQTDGAIGVLEAGTKIVIEYDVPAIEEWYFRENGVPTMPFCVFLEAALQPCGWLASYVGSALTTEKDLSFRNLDGTATIHREVVPSDGVFRTEVEITNISQSAGMIIESFEVKCYCDDELAYELGTVFGFFPGEALANQVGLPIDDAYRAQIEAESDFLVDLTQRPERYCSGTLSLADPMLLMIDRVTAFDASGGREGLGFLRAEKDVDPDEWFFKAHFFQDPVQPGSLGIEAMLQLLQFHMIHTGMAEGIEDARFEPIAVGKPHSWKYRGQVVPKNELISSTVEIIETGTDERGVYAMCDASLWCDGKRIYEAKGLGMRIVSGGLPPFDGPAKSGGANEGEELLDPECDTWLGDHRPTWTVPALALMSMVDRLAGAAGSGTSDVVGLTDVQVQRWLPIPGPTRLATETKIVEGGVDAELGFFREARDPRLSRFETAAKGRVHRRGDGWASTLSRDLPPLEGGEEVDDPYGSGALFHGPAFHYLTQLTMGTNGARAQLDAGAGTVPHGTLNQGLLDACTHAIPHDRLQLWASEIADDLVAYPYRIPEAVFDGSPPTSGDVRVEVRFDGFDGNPRFPAFRVQLWAGDRLWANLRLVEVLLPKGPIGSAKADDRRAFLRDRKHVAGLALSRLSDGETRLNAAEMKGSDWLPGTLSAVYALAGAGADTVREIAVKDHVAQRTGVHPSAVRVVEGGAITAADPLTRIPLEISDEGEDRVVRDSGAPVRDISLVREFWSNWFGIGQWPVEDLYYGLLQRFVRAVHVEDADAMLPLAGKPVLYLANHQVGIESLLFSIIASALNGVPTLALAKVEHKQTWLGQLTQHCFTYPGVEDPGVIAYFDRQDPSSLPRIVAQLREGIEGEAKSLMVHVEGTRSLSCREPVRKMSGVFIDMAVEAGVPIVPVRFVGGLPIEPLEERIEFPIGMGSQEYYLGRPILPEDLQGVPYKERIDRVVAAINGLGPRASEEVPFEGDPVFAAKVDAWVEKTGATSDDATLFRALEELRERGSEVERLLAAAHGGQLRLDDSPKGRWLKELARRLFGEHGPSVA